MIGLLKRIAFRCCYRQDYRILKNLKDRETGKVGFVIGNGPSLQIGDLECLHELEGIVSIASNGIYLSYENTNWRPDYYSIADPLVWKKCKGEFSEFHDRVFSPRSLRAKQDSDDAIYYRHLGVVPVENQRKSAERYFSSDLSVGAFSGGTVTYENLQLAAHLGLNPIYLVGCDHSYAGQGQSKTENVSREILHESGIQNHFSPHYRKPGEKVLSANVLQMDAAFEEARRYSDQGDTRILNATRGGNLEAFERTDLDLVFEKLRNSD
ncbi:MAG: 6-hydroxymethylpterin diphosphokinase MptE-like protein [Verrucomicrobiota bacterium]